MSNYKVRNIIPDNLINETRVTGVLHVTDTTDSTATTGSVVLDGGMAVTKDTNLANTIIADTKTLSIASSGVDRLNVGTTAVNLGLPLLSSEANASIGIGSFTGDNTPALNFYSKNTTSSSTISSQIKSSGGTTSAFTSTLGFDAGVYNFGNTTATSYVNIESTEAPGGPTTGGALRVAGGVAVAGTQYVGGDLIVTGSISGVFTIPPGVTFSYTIPETGGVLRTTDSKFYDVVNVEDFGAVGDGVTDDTTAFTNALKIARTVHARRDGTYLIGDVDILANTEFNGDGCTLTPVAGSDFVLRMKEANTSISNTIFADASENIIKSTTLTAGAAQGATTVSLTSVAGLAVDNQIIIYLDDGKKHHTFIESIASLDVTITDGLDSAATSGNLVKTFEGLVVVGGDASVETTGFSVSKSFFFGASSGLYIKTNARPGQVSEIFAKDIKYSGITVRDEVNDIYFTDIQVLGGVDQTDSSVGNGILDTYTFTTPIHRLADLKVYVNSVLQTITTHYSFVDSTSILFVTPPGAVAVDLVNTVDTATGILIDNRTNTTNPFVGLLSNVIISNCDYGVKLFDTGIASSNLIVKNCYNGLYINGQAADTPLTFSTTLSDYNTNNCIQIEGASVDTCSFSGVIHTINTPTSFLLSGASLGKNIVVGSGSTAYINQFTWVLKDTNNNTLTGTLKYNLEQTFTEAGTLALPGYSFRGDENTGIYAIGDGNIGVVSNGTNILDISSTVVEIENASALRMSVANSAFQLGSFGGANTPEIDFYTVTTSGLGTIPAKISASGGSDANNTATLDFSAANYDFNSSGIVNIDNTTASTFYTLGALVIDGGIGINNATQANGITDGGSLTTAGGMAIGKRLYVGGDGTFTENLIVNNNKSFILKDTGGTNPRFVCQSDDNLVFYGTNAVSADRAIFNIQQLSSTSNFQMNIPFYSNVTTTSTSSTTGSILLDGGIGISDSTDAASVTSGGTFTTAGGIAVAKAAYIGGQVTLGNGVANGFISVASGKSLSLTSNNNLITTVTNNSTVTCVTSNNNCTTFLVKDPTGVTTRLSVDSTDVTTANILSSTNTTASTSSSLGAITTTGGIATSNTTDATSATNGGSITTAGGVGIAKKLFVGTDLDVAGTTSLVDISISGTTASTSATTGALTLVGGLGINNTTDATSATNGGTITTAGGVGIAKKLFVGTDLHTIGNSYLDTNNTSLLFTDVSGTNPRIICQNDDNLIFYGTNAAGADRAIFACGMRSSSSSLIVSVPFNLTDATASTSNTTGSITTAGGIGISDTTEATSATNGGTITTAGGVGIAKKLFVGGVTTTVSIVDTDTTASTSNTTGAITTAGGIASSNATDATSATNGGTITTAGGVGIAKKLFVGTDLDVAGATTTVSIVDTATTASTSSSLGAITTAGGIATSNTTDATSATNGGTITTAGGVGIAKKLFVGTDLDVAGATTTVSIVDTDTTASTSNTTGAITTTGGIGISNTTEATSATNGGTVTTAGGVGIAKKLFVGGIINTVDATASTSSTTGSITTAGGIGISNATEATSATNGGTVTTAGGVGIAKKLFVGGIINTVDATASTSNTTGAITTAGGIGISNTTEATSATNGGTVTTAGGVGIAKKLFVGGAFNVSDATISGSSITGSITTAGGLGISSTTDATSATNGGTITTAGGVGIAKKLFVASGTNATNTTTGSIVVTGGVGVSADLYAANLYNGTFHAVSFVGFNNTAEASFPVSGANGDNTAGYFSTDAVTYYTVLSTHTFTVVAGKQYKLTTSSQQRFVGTGGGAREWNTRYNIAINSTTPVSVNRAEDRVSDTIATAIQRSTGNTYIFTAASGATTATVNLQILTSSTTSTIIFSDLTTELQQLD